MRRLQAQTLPGAAPPLGKISVTFQPIQRYRRPSRLKISEKMSIEFVSLLEAPFSTIWA